MSEPKIYSVQKSTHQELQSKTTGEKLSLSAVLSSNCNFNDIFIAHEILPPGRRDSLPHSHTKKEEMIFILHGCLTLHWGNEILRLNAGEYIGLQPSMVPHYLENNTDVEARYLKICSNPLEDLVHY